MISFRAVNENQVSISDRHNFAEGGPQFQSSVGKFTKYSRAAIPKSPGSKCHLLQLGLYTTIVHIVPNNPYCEGN
jgi:hypothetical protein